MYEKSYPSKRFRITLNFLKKHIPTNLSILDLGVNNPLSDLMRKEGYLVSNTNGEDLDEDRSVILNSQTEVTTAFEILEHLLSPYEVLKSIKSNIIVLSIPLRLWFSKAYKSKTDLRDKHFHEFEDWQLDWLLEKSGWEIIDRKKFTNPTKKIGIRPLLRLITPRYYLVIAKRK
ncbi:MAG: methyltransferase [Flavobacteriaceae bacterium]